MNKYIASLKNYRFAPLFILIFCLSLSSLRAQIIPQSSKLADSVQQMMTYPYILGTSNLDTLPDSYYDIEGVEIKASADDYLKLLYNVRKVYPYAMMAAQRMKEYRENLAELNSRRDKKKYINKAQEDLEDSFSADLKRLSTTQGKILFKLIYRETGETPYDILKEFKGGFKATGYQIGGRFWGYNLKKGYDPQGEDAAIEYIVTQIEAGKYGYNPYTSKGKEYGVK